MNTLSLIVAVCLATAFIVTFVVLPFRPGLSAGRRILMAVASLLVVIGILCFLAPFASCLGGFDWLPPTFEWPIGYAEGVITTTSGLRVVKHSPSNRVQVYDANWRYLRGWRVDAAGGVIALRAGDNDAVEVYTARGAKHFTYSAEGVLLATEPSQNFPGDAGSSERVPTPWWALAVTHPVGGWGLAAVGMIMTFIADRGASTNADASRQSAVLNRLLNYVQGQTNKGPRA